MAEWESEDWCIKRAHEFYAEPLAQFRLTLAQKVLLMYNNTGIRRHSCISMMSADIGHVTQAHFSQVPFYQAFDWEFIVDHKDWKRQDMRFKRVIYAEIGKDRILGLRE